MFQFIEHAPEQDGTDTGVCSHAPRYCAFFLYNGILLMNEETAYEAAIGNVEEIEVNGNKGVIGESNISVEIDGVMYMLMASASGIGNEQLIKMAESIH